MIPRRQLPPDTQDAVIAHKIIQSLSKHMQDNTDIGLCITDHEQAEPVKLPTDVVASLMNILEIMARGQGFTVISEDTELTTVQAADILNVSRPFLINLLNEQKIPHHKVGTHRRIRMEDVMAYKTSIDDRRRIVLDQLVAEAQEHDLGYSKP